MLETLVPGFRFNGIMDASRLDFEHVMALVADQEAAGVTVIRLVTADKGVERCDAMHQPHLLQKIQGPVDGRGRPSAPPR